MGTARAQSLQVDGHPAAPLPPVPPGSRGSRLGTGVLVRSSDARCGSMASRVVPRSNSARSWVRKARPCPTISSTTSSPCQREEGDRMGHPQGTCGQAQLRAWWQSAGHGCAGVRQGTGDMQLLCGCVGSDPKLQGQTHGWLCSGWTWEHVFQLGRVRCALCGGKVRDATSVAEDNGPKGCQEGTQGN